jgi:Predicted transcriptional regulators
MSKTHSLYMGCPVQHARQFIGGKWQMGILWNLGKQSMSFSEIKCKLPGLSDKILTQELNFFIQKEIICRSTLEFPTPKTEYTLSHIGLSLIPVINSIVEWGFKYLQDEKVNNEMNATPLPAIEAIEKSIAGRE